MAQFSYFVQRELNPRDLQHSQLPERLQAVLYDSPLAARGVDVGPAGAKGVVVSVESRYAIYSPTRQYWHKSTCGEYWIGWSKDSLPSADDLKRPKTLDGDWVEIADGRKFLVPIIHPPTSTIPRARGWGENGEVKLVTLPRYERIMAAGELYYDKVANSQPLGFWNEWEEFLAGLLAVNYRIGLEECRALQCCFESTLDAYVILGVCLGFDAVAADLAAQKKTATLDGGIEGSQPEGGTQAALP